MESICKNLNCINARNRVVTTTMHSSGILAESYECSAFGKTSIFNSSGQQVSASVIGNPYMFIARRFDAESKLYYYRARMYNAENRSLRIVERVTEIEGHP